MFKKTRQISAIPSIVLLTGLLTGLVFAESGLAAGCRPKTNRFPVESGFPQSYSDLKPDPAVYYGRLDNGFKYVLMENQRPENRVNVHLMVEAGSLNETDAQQGLAHYLEHLLFCGSEHFPPGELIKYFQKIGMRFGNDANAHTGFFHTVYDLHLPGGDRNTLQEGLTVIKDYAEGALLLESEVDRERSVILAEKRTRDSVGYRTYKASLDFELPGTRIIERYPIGVEDVISGADSAALKKFYDTWYRPELMTLVMVGDFKTRPARSLIKEMFSSLTARAPSRPAPALGRIQWETDAEPAAFYHYEEEAGTTDVTIETIRQEPRPHDSVERIKQVFIRNLAFGILDDRLDELVESGNSPFIFAGAGAGRSFKEVVYASISAECAPEDWQEALAGIEQELRKALAYGFTEAEVERVQKNTLAAFDRAVKQVSTRESGVLARQLRGHLAGDRVFQSPEQARKLLAPVVKSLTPEILHQALRDSWQDKIRLVLVTGNAVIEDQGIVPADRILTVYKDSQAATVALPEIKEKPVFPYLPAPEPGKVVRRETREALGISQVTFENQVRLNYKKTDFKANQVAAQIIFGQGEFAEPVDKPALCELGEAVIERSGFGQMTREDLRQALAGKKAAIALSVGEGEFTLAGSCATDEVELLCQLFYTFIKDFGCRPEAYQLALRSIKQAYEEMGHTIGGAMRLQGDRFLAGGDSRFGWPANYDAFTAVSQDDIRSWMGNALARSVPEISVVGDFDEETLVQAVATYFGGPGIPPRAISPLPDRPDPDFPEGRLLRLDVPTEINKGVVDVTWPTDDFWDIHQTRRLNVLADIINERMRQEIREETGQSYSQYAYNDASLAYADYGVFHAVVQIAPKEADSVAAAIKAIAQDLVENGLTEDELRRAVDPTRTQIKEMIKTNSYWLNSVLSGSTMHPEQFDWCRTLLADYEAITVDEIRQLAATYLDNNKSATVIIVPEVSGPGGE